MFISGWEVFKKHTENDSPQILMIPQYIQYIGKGQMESYVHLSSVSDWKYKVQVQVIWICAAIYLYSHRQATLYLQVSNTERKTNSLLKQNNCILVKFYIKYVLTILLNALFIWLRIKWKIMLFYYIHCQIIFWKHSEMLWRYINNQNIYWRHAWMLQWLRYLCTSF